MRKCLPFTLAIAALAAVSCNAPKNNDRPSGLKNMAPPSIQETVQDGLDVEPNNTFLQATDISMTSDVMQWNGTLEGNDIDVWHIKAKAGTIADISVTPLSDFDILTDFTVTPNDAQRRHFDTKPAGDPELMPNIRITPQGIFLTIRARLHDNHPPVQYQVALSRLINGDADAVIESESNDNRDTAISITGNAHVQGVLFPSGDIDYYRLPLTAPASISFTPPDGPAEIAIENKNKVIWSKITQSAQTVQSDLLTPDLQDVFIRVKSLGDLREPIKYAFSIATIDKVPDEIEPNNTIEKAQTIPSNGQTPEFSLLDDADIDIFKFSADPEAVYRIHLTGPQKGQAKLQLLAANSAVRSDFSGDDMTVCDATAAPDSTMFVKISPISSPWPLPYHLSIDHERAENVEIEPNQTTQQATLLPPGASRFGHIYPPGDIDIYRIDLPEYPKIDGPIGTLHIDIDGGYVAKLHLQLQDNAGYEISQLQNEQYSKPMHMSFDAPNGTYFLAISGDGDSCLKPYAVKARFVPNDEAIASLTAIAEPETAVPAQQPAPVPENAQAQAPENAQAPSIAPENAPEIALPTENAQDKAPEPAQAPTTDPSNPTNPAPVPGIPAPQNAPLDPAPVDIPIDDLLKAAEESPAAPTQPSATKDDEDAF